MTIKCIGPVVGADRGAALLDAAPAHSLRGLPLGAAVGLGDLDIDAQAVAVLGERMRHVAQLRLGELALLEQSGFRVRHALVRLVAALLMVSTR